jgi:hypothetical protein
LLDLLLLLLLLLLKMLKMLKMLATAGLLLQGLRAVGGSWVSCRPC